MLVLDASVTLAWFLEGDSAAQREYALGIAKLIEADMPSLIVPGEWHTEMGSTLVREWRADRLSTTALNAAISRLDQLPIETHHRAHTPGEIVKLAIKYHLAGYDALYLDLAHTLGVPLATIDRGLVAAARRFDVALIEVE